MTAKSVTLAAPWCRFTPSCFSFPRKGRVHRVATFVTVAPAGLSDG
jgi:hypothetical protein